MSDCRHNLLSESLVSVSLASSVTRRCSLPELMVLAQQDIITDFPALRPHQSPAWHMFLVQLAVMAVEAVGGEVPDDEAGWRVALRGLTPDFAGDEPWCLLVEDWQKPAFLQSPLPSEDARSDYKHLVATPDALDILVTSKNHDLKSERMARVAVEDWLFALICIQTTGNAISGSYHAVMRMASGGRSRPMVRVYATNMGAGAQVFRDVDALLQHTSRWRKQVFAVGFSAEPTRHRLLWLRKWDGLSRVPVSSIDPLLIEVCRRIRVLQNTDGQLYALKAVSKRHVDAAAMNGCVADPWIPVVLGEESRALSVDRSGLNYRVMVQLMDGEIHEPSYLQTFNRMTDCGDSGLVFMAAALGRDKKGTSTEGYYQRRVIWGEKARSMQLTQPMKFIKRAREFLKISSQAWDFILKESIQVMMFGKEKPLKKKDPVEYARWVGLMKQRRDLLSAYEGRLDNMIDQQFFDELDASFEAEESDGDAGARWEQVMAGLIREQFNRAALALPRKGEGRYLAEARARNRLEGALRKEYASLRQPKSSQDAAEQEDADVNIKEEHV